MTKQNDIIQQLIDKTYLELNKKPKPTAKSRVWKSPRGYKFLVQWSNAMLLKILAKKYIALLKSSKYPLNSSKLLSFLLKKNQGNYRTLKDIKGKDITYEILIELTNKTDYLLRKLVESLKTKLNTNHKGYQVEKAHLRLKTSAR